MILFSMVVVGSSLPVLSTKLSNDQVRPAIKLEYGGFKLNPSESGDS